jgi:hypothetical protein
MLEKYKYFLQAPALWLRTQHLLTKLVKPHSSITPALLTAQQSAGLSSLPSPPSPAASHGHQGPSVRVALEPGKRHRRVKEPVRGIYVVTRDLS